MPNERTEGADGGRFEATVNQLLAVIEAQTEIARLGLDLNGVMSLVAERALAISSATGSVVELADGDDMVYRAASGSARSFLGIRIPKAGSLSGLCVQTGENMLCHDTEDDTRVDQDSCRRIGVRSMIVVPLTHDGAARGVLKVFAARPAAFGPQDVRILDLMSGLIGASMFHAATYGADELFRQATTDALTGVANRALFMDRLRSQLAIAKREKRSIGVLMLDMDGLKPINDRLGHRTGDAAIKEVALRLVATARQSDTVARLGGDEFACLLTTLGDGANAERAMERISLELAKPFEFDGQPLKLAASMGVATYPDHGDRPEELLESADQAMYRAKRLRRGGNVR